MWLSLRWVRPGMELAARVWFFKGCFVSPLRGRTTVEDLVFVKHRFAAMAMAFGVL
jgi:hypothetical protein